VNLSPQGGLVDLLDPPRIDLRIQVKNSASSARQTEPPSLEQELQATRSLRERCERLLGELGCAVEPQTGRSA